MAWIGGSEGVFRLHASDVNCGSMISLDDAAEIFDVQSGVLSSLDGKEIKVVESEGESFVNELDLHKAWGSGALQTPHPPRVGSANRSLDELILMRLVQIAFPSSKVEPQQKVGRCQVDLVVELDGKRTVIEFFGPTHFIQHYQAKIKPPAARQKTVEETFGFPCVIWPYWIQRCEKNLRAIFDPSVEGIASVWSTRAHFGDFQFDNSAEIITGLTQRFNALTKDGIGYMYLNTRTINKPIHPIVKRIHEGKASSDKLIPRGNKVDSSFWLPHSVKKNS